MHRVTAGESIVIQEVIEQVGQRRQFAADGGDLGFRAGRARPRRAHG